MVSQSVGGLGEFNYGIFYIPSISLGYIYAYTTVEASHSILHIHNQNLWILSLVALFSGALFHRIMRSIFGREGPGSNPKNKWVVRYYTNSLLNLQRPKSHPDNALNIISDVIWNTFSVKDKHPVIRVISWILILLFIVYWPLYYYSLYLLVIAIHSGTDSLIIGILLFLQTAILVRRHLSTFFPSVVSPKEQDWIDVPEYRRAKVVSECENLSERQKNIPDGLPSASKQMFIESRRERARNDIECEVAPVDLKPEREKITYDSESK